MATFEYTTTQFNKPQPIMESQYHELKRQILSNPNFEIMLEEESFFEYFKGNFITIGIGFIGGFILFTIADKFDGTYLLFPFMFAAFFMFFFMGVLGIFRLFLESSSYTKSENQKKDYFRQMKIAIEQTEEYDDFVKLFYS